jgi:TldD protein
VRQKLKTQIDQLKAKGVTYADVRWYPREDQNFFVMHNGNLKALNASSESGAGVRVLYKGAWGFSASSDLADLDTLFDKALDNARIASERVTFPIRLAEKDAIQDSFSSPNKINPFDIPLEEKVDFLKRVDQAMNQPGVMQRVSFFRFDNRQQVYIDSEGSEIEKNIINVFTQIRVMGMDKDGGMQSRAYLPGRTGMTRGWESLEEADFMGNADRIVKELNQLLVAPDCPKDKMSVILMPDIMFLQVHETIGHPLELDRILGYELSFAGGSFVRLEDFGTLRYGSEKLTARANALEPNTPGSFGFDDDGVPAQDNVLIDKGILVGAITGRQMVEEANATARKIIFEGSSGANRASAFYRVPIERMTNINVDPGTDGSLEDIIANTERGIILDGDKSWSIGSNREQFHFANHIGWMVEDGKRTHVVKNPTYRGETVPFYNSLSAVGDESTWHVHYVDNCGKGQPSQIMELGHGVPICKFDDVTVGD